MDANPSFRTKRRRDSGTVKNYLQELEELLQEVEMNVGLVIDEWLSTSINGKHLCSLILCLFPMLIIITQPMKKKTTRTFARPTCQR